MAEMTRSKWFYRQTLLGGPDINSKTLIREDSTVATFNDHMTKEWTESDTGKLKEVVRLLNELE